MTQTDRNTGWQVKVLKPRLPWRNQAILPAEVSDGLMGAMLRRENVLEDVHYNKIVPNVFIVELSQENYERNYRPIEAEIVRQWREKLLEHLMTANSRQGRKEYRFGGQLHIEVRSSPDLKDSQARILSRVQPGMVDPSGGRAVVAYLEMVPGGQRWPLYEGDTTIGRDRLCDIYLDMPVVLEKRLVSGQHAWIRCRGGQCILYDGSPRGKPSANGTYINARRILGQGQLLQEGDTILLAAVDPLQPQANTPGVVLFRFHQAGEE